jgi:hypothetical protein
MIMSELIGNISLISCKCASSVDDRLNADGTIAQRCSSMHATRDATYLALDVKKKCKGKI